MVGQKYPASKTFLARAFAPRCCPHMPSCVSARASWASFGPRHLIRGMWNPLLYKVPSTRVNEQTLRFSLVLSLGSEGSFPLEIYQIKGPRQSWTSKIALISCRRAFCLWTLGFVRTSWITVLFPFVVLVLANLETIFALVFSSRGTSTTYIESNSFILACTNRTYSCRCSSWTWNSPDT